MRCEPFWRRSRECAVKLLKNGASGPEKIRQSLAWRGQFLATKGKAAYFSYAAFGSFGNEVD